MKTAIIYISLLSLIGCGKDVKVQSFETKMQCFRTHTGIQCVGDGIQCKQQFRSPSLDCRITVITRDGERQPNPLTMNRELEGEVIRW